MSNTHYPNPASDADDSCPAESLADFQEGQWWINELDAVWSCPTGEYMRITEDMKRAVSVVHNLLQTARKFENNCSPAEPVYGDLLPPVGSRVFIRHGRDNAAHPCRVTGYYAWGDLAGNKNLHRVFVQLVYEGTNTPQSRLLRDCYPTPEAALADDVVLSDSGMQKALEDAAQSLETIANLAGRKTYGTPPIETFMGHHDEVRHYAASRAKAARAALSAQPTETVQRDLLDNALTHYLDAQDALDNREYAGINAEPYERLIRARNSARRDLEDAMDAQKGN